MFTITASRKLVRDGPRQLQRFQLIRHKIEPSVPPHVGQLLRHSTREQSRLRGEVFHPRYQSVLCSLIRQGFVAVRPIPAPCGLAVLREVVRRFPRCRCLAVLQLALGRFDGSVVHAVFAVASLAIFGVSVICEGRFSFFEFAGPARFCGELLPLRRLAGRRDQNTFERPPKFTWMTLPVSSNSVGGCRFLPSTGISRGNVLLCGR